MANLDSSDCEGLVMQPQVKRVYDPPDEEDGKRILVDRLWPRGLTRGKAAVDMWLKEIAPSTELRRWYHRDTARWQQFRDRYFAELDQNAEVVDHLRQELSGKATLLYAGKDNEFNNARALLEYLFA